MCAGLTRVASAYPTAAARTLIESSCTHPLCNAGQRRTSPTSARAGQTLEVHTAARYASEKCTTLASPPDFDPRGRASTSAAAAPVDLALPALTSVWLTADLLASAGLFGADRGRCRALVAEGDRGQSGDRVGASLALEKGCAGSPQVVTAHAAVAWPWQCFHLRPLPQVQGSLRPRRASCVA